MDNCHLFSHFPLMLQLGGLLLSLPPFMQLENAHTHAHTNTCMPTHTHLLQYKNHYHPNAVLLLSVQSIILMNGIRQYYCKALYDFYGDMPCDLQFKKVQRIAIVTWTESQDDWWERTVNDKTGIFPANYVLQLL